MFHHVRYIFSKGLIKFHVYPPWCCKTTRWNGKLKFESCSFYLVFCSAVFRVYFYLPVQQVWLDVDAACRGALPASDIGRSPFSYLILLVCFKAQARRNKALELVKILHSKLLKCYFAHRFFSRTFIFVPTCHKIFPICFLTPGNGAGVPNLIPKPRRNAPPRWREWHQHLNCRNLEKKKQQKHETVEMAFQKKKFSEKNDGKWWQMCCSPRLLTSESARPVLVDKKDKAPASFRKTLCHRSLKVETFRRKKWQLIGEISTNNVPKNCLSLRHARKIWIQENLNILRTFLSVSDLLFLFCSGKMCSPVKFFPLRD